MSTAPVCTRRRDWFRILRDLVKAGISYSEVGRKVNRSTTTVRMWADGSEPRESDARIVLALYARYCPVQYQAHQREFDIRIEIEGITSSGESHALPFVG